MSTSLTAIVAIAATLLCASSAGAGQYSGRGDTGWIEAGKRECCDHAIALAQDDSAAACRLAGGTPNPLRGGIQRRGFCQWESAVDDDGVRLFRCYAEATSPCR